MTALTPTPAQAERAARNRMIAADYQSLRKAFPAAPVMQILRTIASWDRYGLKPEGLKRILLESGDIKPKRRS